MRFCERMFHSQNIARCLETRMRCVGGRQRRRALDSKGKGKVMLSLRQLKWSVGRELLFVSEQ